MTDPVTGTLAAIGIGSSLLGGVTGAQGAQQQAQAQASADMFQSQEAMYQAGVSAYNQQLAQANASFTRYTGEVEAQQAGISLRQDIGTIRAAQGAGGLDVNSGSNLAVRQSQYEVGEENIALIRSNAARAAYNYDVQAYQSGQQMTWEDTASSYYTQAASYAKTAGDINATSSILGSIGKVASMGLSSYKSGIFGGGGSTASS